MDGVSSTYVILLFSMLEPTQGTFFSSRFTAINTFPSSDRYETLKGDMVQYRHGDILIGALMRVHRRGKEEHCSEIQEDGIQAVETMNMVVDRINADPNVLKGIKVGTVMVDTCDVDTHALDRVVNVFLPFFFGNDDSPIKPPLFAGVVGAASSSVSIQTASLLQIFKIPQVSMWSTNPNLSNKIRFPYFFRTVPSDTNQATAMLELVQKMGWNYISVVYEDDFYGVQGYREIEDGTEDLGICIASALPIPRYTTDQSFVDIVNELIRNKQAKAVIVFTKIADAERLIAAADRNPEARGHFLFIGSDGWSGQIPTGTLAGKDYLDSLDRSISFSPSTTAIEGLDSYVSDLTLQDHMKEDTSEDRYRNPWFLEYLARTINCSVNVSARGAGVPCRPDDHVNKEAFITLSKMQNVADAVLAIVTSLDKHLNNTCGEEKLCDIINSTMGTNKLADDVSEIMKNISFPGINGGTFKFDANHDGPALYNIKRFNKNLKTSTPLLKWKISGVFKNDKISWTNSMLPDTDVNSVCSEPCPSGLARVSKTSVCCWTCQACLDNQFVSNGTNCENCPLGKVPSTEKNDCVAVEIRSAEFADTHSLASIAVAGFGIVITLLIAIIFHSYRETAVVKASGKELCSFVFAGAMLCFTNTFVLSVPPSTASCSVSRFLVSFGPTLMYSALITKTIRVVIIFQSKKFLSAQVKKFLRPSYQILTTLLFSFLQVCVFAAWLTFSIPTTTIIYSDNNTKAFLVCEDTEGVIILVAFAYPFLLILACTVLATINRNVPTGFNETQYIGFTMYATCVIWLAFLPIFITNSANIRLKVATLAICVSLSAITILLSLFGYRCFVIIFKPEENTQKSVMSVTNSGKTNLSMSGKVPTIKEQPPSEEISSTDASSDGATEPKKNERKQTTFCKHSSFSNVEGSPRACAGQGGATENTLEIRSDRN